MEKKLLSLLFIFTLFILNPVEGFGQCPTSVNISADPGSTVCTGTEVTFTANHTDGENHTYQWQINGVNVSGATNKDFVRNNLNNSDQIRVVVRSTSATCSTTSDFIAVVVNPKPTVTTANTAIVCSGAGSNISLTASTPSSFSWTIGNITGSIIGASTGNGSTINQTLTNPSSSTAGTVQYIVTPTSTTGSCTGEPYTITVTVNPKPTVSTANTATICSGASPNIALSASTPSTFSWTVGSITGNITGATNGTGSTINQALNNPSNSATGTVQYIVTPTATTGSCAGEPYTITITVNPKPTVTTANTATVCSGASPNISLTASAPSSFSWTVGSINGNITGASAGSGTTINQTLTNPSNSTAGTVQYIVTPTATTGGCAGTPQIITVTVNPRPTVNTANTATVCSGTGTNISLTASTQSSFSWTIGAITGGITGASAGTGATINQTLTNPSNSSAGTVQYIVTPTATTGSCAGTPYTITVTVNPKPTVTTANTSTTCSGAGPNISLTASTPSSFAWTIGAITGGITGAGAGNGSTINQTLTNPSNSSAGTVQYIVTPTATAGSCAGAPYTITVTVNPKPAVTTATTKIVCSGFGPNISLAASTASSFSWTIGAITGGITGASAGSGEAIDQALTNPSTSAAGTVQYIVTPTANAGSCAGTPYTITVTVNPTLVPSVTITSTSTDICISSPSGSTPVTFTATPVNEGDSPTYQWKNGGTNVGTNSATYTANSLANNSQISVVMTSNATCASTVTATSNIITMSGFTPPAAPVFSPAPSQAGSINTTLLCPPNTGLVYTVTSDANVSSYSWSLPAGWVITSGAGTNSITINNSNLNAGTYNLVATARNACGSSSTTLPITINTAASVYAGADASVCKDGSYQLNDANVSGYINEKFISWSASPGGSGTFSNTTALNPTFTPSISSGTITLTLTSTKTTGNANCSVLTDQMILTVNAPPAITAQPSPTAQSLCLNAPPTQLSVTATGAGLTYQWYRNTTNSNSGGTLITGATSSIYTPLTTTAGTLYYYVIVSGTCTPALTSSVSGAIIVNALPAITAQPSTTAQNLCPNATAAQLSVTATGAGLTYQWYSNTTNSNSGGTSLGAGATSSTYTPVTTTAGTLYYYVVVSGTCNPAVTSNVSGAVTVNALPAITAQPSTTTQTLCPNAAPTPLSVTATGAGLTYQWYSNTANSNTGGTLINNATTSTYTPVTTTAGTLYYYVVVTGTCTPAATSDVSGAVTVNAPPAITAQPSTTEQTLCLNAAATQLSVTATGAGTTYQWYSNTTNSNSGGTSLGAGSTSSTYTPVTTAAGTLYYYVIVSGTCSPPVTSSVSGAITVNEAPAITAQPSITAETLCLNAAATELSVTATGASLTYQWYSNTTNSNSGGTSLGAGATSSTYTPVTTTAGTLYYYVIVSGICTPSVTSDVSGGVTVNEAPAITAQPSKSLQTLCLNGSATELFVTATGVGLTYQWYSNSTNSNSGGTSLGASATSSTYTPVTNTAGTLYYYVIVSGTCTPAVTSNVSGGVTVNEPVQITTDLDNSETYSVCAGFPTEFTIEASGTGLTYQWQLDGEDINGATSATYSIGQASSDDDGIYKVIVSGSAPCTEDISNEVTLTVNQSITIETQPAATVSSCEGDSNSVILTVVADGDISEFLWRKDGIPLSDGGNISGSTTAELTIANQTPDDSGRYDVVISSPAESCSQIISNPSVVTVNSKSADPVSASASEPEICLEATTILTLNGGGDGTGEVINWYTDSNGTTLVGTGNDLSVSPAVTTTYYGRYEDPQDCYQPSAFASVEVTVNYDSTIALSSVAETDAQTVCINNAITDITYVIGGSSTGASITAGSLPSGVDGIFTNNVFTISGTPEEAGTFNYTITTEGSCEEASITGTITVNGDSSITLTSGEESNSQTICINSALSNITYLVSGGATSAILVEESLPQGITWEFNDDVLTISGIPTEPGTFNYSVTTVGNCVEETLSGSITVDDVATVSLTSSTESSSQTLCINTPITAITYSVGGGATGVDLSGNLPEGISQNYDPENRIFTISGTPTSAGIFDYEITTTGPCENNSITGKITVDDDSTITLSSEEGTHEQIICINNVLIPIEYSVGGGATGAAIIEGELPAGVTGEFTAGIFRISGTPTESGTYTYKIETSGPCENVSIEGTLIIDPTTVGGEVVVQGTSDKTILVCHKADEDSVTPLELVGAIGEVLRWEYSTDSGQNWTPVTPDEDNPHLLGYEGITETRIYRAIVKSGSCNEVSSAVAIVSVIPNQKPSPVSASPEVVCLGEEVELFSESSFATGRNLASGGTFNNANPEGWLADGCGNCLNSGGSNTKETGFRLSATNGGTYSGVQYTSDNKFAITNGNFDSTMETPVFNLIGITDGSLEFSHSYKLVGNAEIYVEISTDGGNTYSSILWEQRDPDELTPHQNFHNSAATKMDIDLSAYLGLANLKIRFVYKGSTGSSWAIDNITIPDAPVDERMEWVDEQTGEVISTTETAIVTPLTPGINYYRVTSYINGCRSFGDDGTEIVEVFAYDTYTAEAGVDQSLTCGTNSVVLNGQIISYYHDGEVTEFSDGASAVWTIESGPDGGAFSDDNDPKATFTASVPGVYTLRFTITTDEDAPCEDSYDEVIIEIQDIYTTAAVAEAVECGVNSIQLHGTVSGQFQGEITTFPLQDGSVTTWEVIDNPEGYTPSVAHFSNENTSLLAINDPNAIFTPDLVGDYLLRWNIMNENGCEHIIGEVPIQIFDNYTSTASFEVSSCETNEVQLHAITSGAIQGENISLPTPDATSGKWEVIESPGDYTFSEAHFAGEITDPTVVFTPVVLGEYTLQWTLINEDLAAECIIPATVSFKLFDQYTLTADAEAGSCGNFVIQLTGTTTGIWQEPVTYPTQDGYIGQWSVIGGEGSFSNAEGDNEFEPVNNPNAIFTTNALGDYTFTWELVPDPDYEGEFIEKTSCPAPPAEISVEIRECIALDFDGFDDYVDLGNGYTGTYSLEAWILPEQPGGTVISGPGYNITTPDGATIGKWNHIAVSNGNLYLDGVLQDDVSISLDGGEKTVIGALWTDDGPTEFFNGYIEEIRIWKDSISEKNIRFTMNQRLKPTDNIGVEVDMDHPDSPDYANLAGYYQLLASPADILPGGLTPDLANNKVAGKLMNMETMQENTAPLPYYTGNDGSWDTAATWGEPVVWKIANTNGVNWNIVRSSHNVNATRDISVLGLISEDNTLNMVGNIPDNESHEGVGDGNALTISHYLRLDGIIDLNGESQLLQPDLSIVDPASTGHLDRDQQGKRNSFIYNYWSSPVSTKGSGNNGGYTVAGVLLDGTIPTAPATINFQDYHGAADGDRKSPIIISTYWLWGYSPAAANVYAEWDHIRAGGILESGEGFTMKGTAGDAELGDGQNYTFRGKPHNGDIYLDEKFGPNQNYLIGNPYPSAIDAAQFITENLGVFDGSLYFWDHFEKVNHILKEYIGGYAVRNLTDGVPAASVDERINNTGDVNTNKYPGPYIPVGQGFLVNSSNPDPNSTAELGGVIKFSNKLRTFEVEGSLSSVFLKPEIVEKTSNSKNKDWKKIRLSFSSPVGYWRQILVGAVPGTTDGFDLGYDAHLFDDNVEDMYWVQGNNNLVIQGVNDFNKDRVLPLGVKIKEEKEFTIRIDTVENDPASLKIYLNDKLNDSIHDLREGPYVSKSEPGYIHDRFEIIFYKDEPVPPVVEIPGEVDEDDEIYKEFGISIRHGQRDRELQILNPHELSITNMYMFDLNGNKLEGHSNLPGGKEFKMPVRNYSSGIYIVQLVVEGRVVSKRIIINN